MPSLSISFTVSDEDAARVRAALEGFGHIGVGDPIEPYVKGLIKQHIVARVKQWETDNAVPPDVTVQ